ncbi:MAG: Rdx family protein [Chloroflexi bacterium]|nr:Rdx family protein [Chloroflexota bacterium]
MSTAGSLAGGRNRVTAMSVDSLPGGVFEVRIGDELIFSRKEAGRFPEPRELKDAVRAALGLPPAPRHD